MTTKEFITMLQEEDPSGNAHIRLHGGVPVAAEHKAGYWDGPYSYIDDEGNYCVSIEDSKVDIHVIDMEDFVIDLIDIENPNNWVEIQTKLKFKLDGYSNADQRNERINNYLKSAKKTYDEIHAMKVKHYEEEVTAAIEHAAKGWKWFQNKEVDNGEKGNIHAYYTWLIYDGAGKQQTSNVYNVQPVLKSGRWTKLDNEEMSGYYQWVYNN